MRLAAYCRVSTDREAQLESLENQKAFFAEFAGKYGHELVRVYADEGLSGRQMSNRKAFLQMLSDAETGLFEMVAVKDISRFARNTVDFLCATRRLRALRIEVQFLSNSQTILGGSEFVLTLFSALAQEESANLSKRVRFGKRVNARRGRVPNLIYGYDQLDTFTLAVNPQEAEVVRRVFSLYQNEGMGAHRIALLLNGEGVPGKKGGRWTSKTVRRMLRNPIYCGILVNNKYETVDFLTGRQVRLPADQQFVHERPAYAIVPKALFEQVQRTADARAGQYAANERHSSRHLFSGLIRCGSCGHLFTRRQYTYRNTFLKWGCSGHNQYTADFCPNAVSIDEQMLLEELERFLDRAVPDREAFLERVARICRRSDRASDRSDAGRRLAQLNRRAERYRAMCADGLIGFEELARQVACLDAERERLCGRLREDCPEADWTSRVRERFALPGWTNADLRELIDRIAVFPDGRVEIAVKPLFGGSDTCG